MVFGLSFGSERGRFNRDQTTNESGTFNNTFNTNPVAPGEWLNNYYSMLGQYGGGRQMGTSVDDAPPGYGLTPYQGQAAGYQSGMVANNPAMGGIQTAQGVAGATADYLGGLTGQLDDMNRNYWNEYAAKPSYTIGSLETNWPDLYQKSDPVTAQNVEATQGSQYMDSYRNPYTGQVVDAALSDFDVGRDRGLTSIQAGRDAGSAFGSRANLSDAIYQADTARGRGSLSGNLRAKAFDTAAGYGQQDANRFYGASSQNARNALTADTFNSNQNLARTMFDVDAAYRGDEARKNALAAMEGNIAMQGNMGMSAADLMNNAAQLGVLGNQMGNENANLLFNMGGMQFSNMFDLLNLGINLFGEEGEEAGDYASTGTTNTSGTSSGTTFGATGSFGGGGD